MRVLLVKMSSLGDVLHAMPAISDAHEQVADIRFDWVVEEEFAQIPAWHPAVDRVVPAATRRWRKHPWSTRGERRIFSGKLLERQYDLVIDSQGLMKSAVIARRARGLVAGFDRKSVREGIAAMYYQRRFHVQRRLHAIERQRRLFALALEYEHDSSKVDYEIDTSKLPEAAAASTRPYIVALHGTTWPSKRFGRTGWKKIIECAEDAGFDVLLPWGGEAERLLANELTAGLSAKVLSTRLELGEFAALLKKAAGAIAVDTGLGHLAAALSVPCISVYGATDPGLTGTVGEYQGHVSAGLDCVPCLSRECAKLTDAGRDPPCYETVSPDKIWRRLEALMGGRGSIVQSADPGNH